MKIADLLKMKGIKPPPPPVTDEERARLEKDYERTHPSGVRRISGCCDNAENDPNK
jgi:hypothetical protein